MKALVTGASRGIGRAIVRALLAESASVALAVRDPASVADWVADAAAGARAATALDADSPAQVGHSPGHTAEGALAVALAVDLRRSEDVDRLVPRAMAALGGLDVLVNCAGIVHYRALPHVSHAELSEQLEVNFVAPFMLSQAAAAHMARSGGGVILNVASTLGLRPAPQTAAYAASKAALIALTRSLALEFGAQHVRANALAPGLIDTDMIRAPRSAGLVPAAQWKALAQLPLLKRLGTPEEIAGAALLLIRNPYITGAVLEVDGGLLLA